MRLFDLAGVGSTKSNLQFNIIVTNIALYGTEPSHLYGTTYWEDTNWLKELADFLNITFQGRLGIPVTEIAEA